MSDHTRFSVVDGLLLGVLQCTKVLVYHHCHLTCRLWEAQSERGRQLRLLQAEWSGGHRLCGSLGQEDTEEGILIEGTLVPTSLDCHIIEECWFRKSVLWGF